MTRDEILALEAGRELDALIAGMMGMVICVKHDVWPGEWCRECQRHAAEAYSIKLVPAWKVIEKMQDEWLPSVWHDGQLWLCRLDDLHVQFIASAVIVPEAICKTALLTKAEND